MRYPLLSRLVLSRFKEPGKPSIPLAPSQIEGIREYVEQCANGAYSFVRVPCLCGSNRSYCIGLNDRYGLSVESHLCMRCGILRTNPRLTEESLNKFYTELYGTISDVHKDIHGVRPSFDAQKKTVAELQKMVEGLIKESSKMEA